jgi:hypothetical protein
MERKRVKQTRSELVYKTGRGFSALQKFEKDRLQFKEEIAA